MSSQTKLKWTFLPADYEDIDKIKIDFLVKFQASHLWGAD